MYHVTEAVYRSIINHWMCIHLLLCSAFHLNHSLQNLCHL